MKKAFFYSILVLLISLITWSCGPINANPNVPSNPSPEDGAVVENISNVVLSWECSDPNGDPLTFDIYFGTDETNLELLESNWASTTYNLTDEVELNYSTTYYWQIIAKDNKGGVTAGPVWSFSTELKTATLILYVTDSKSGPAVSDSSVKVFGKNGDLRAEGQTDTNGRVELNVILHKEEEMLTIILEKYGYALSGVEGLKLRDGDEIIYEVIQRKATLDPDPSTQELPEVEVEFYEEDGETPLDINNVTGDIYVHITASGDNHINIIYAAVGKIPGAGFFGERLYVSNSQEATGIISTAGFEGETEVHIVVYDHNDNRVDYVFYVNVNKEGETTLEKYVPLKWSDFGYTNLDAYTRLQKIAFYAPPLSKKMKKLEKLGKEVKPLAAPENSNLWVDIWWIDYQSAVSWGLIDPTQYEEPEAYVIYRSFDGVSWEKIGVVREDSSVNYLYRDSSPLLEPGKRVWYKVTSWYPDGESNAAELGSVVPLDSFNVILVEPEDGETNVSRDPVFVWMPDKELSSPEGDVTYEYAIWVYDLVLSEMHLVPYDSNTFFKHFYSVGKETMSVKFSDHIWIFYDPSFDPNYWYFYPYDKLEPNKTYEWGMDLAVAYAVDDDSAAYSIAVDYGYGYDYFGVEADIFNTFTTGEE